MKKIIFILFSTLLINNVYSLSCSNPEFEDYIINTHILKGKLTNKTEIESDSWVEQYFLIEPTKFFTKKTDEKLIVYNIVNKLTIEKSKMSKQELDEIGVFDINYDILLDTSKEYYFFVDKDSNKVTVGSCSSFVLEESKLKEGYISYKALSLFNNDKYPLIK